MQDELRRIFNEALASGDNERIYRARKRYRERLAATKAATKAAIAAEAEATAALTKELQELRAELPELRRKATAYDEMALVESAKLAMKQQRGRLQKDAMRILNARQGKAPVKDIAAFFPPDPDGQ